MADTGAQIFAARSSSALAGNIRPTIPTSRDPVVGQNQHRDRSCFQKPMVGQDMDCRDKAMTSLTVISIICWRSLGTESEGGRRSSNDGKVEYFPPIGHLPRLS